MKTAWAFLGLLALSLATPLAQESKSDAQNQHADSGQEKAFAVTERGPNHKTWERIEYEPGLGGRLVERKHQYEELATGLNYFENGEWRESEAKIEILPNNAGAAAVKGQHKVIFPPEIKSGIIEVQTPDGQWLRSRVWGLAYFDGTTGESVLLAEVKESEGQLIGDNTVNYPDAFTDFRADVRYTYTLAGFEQDVVLREQPPAPEAFNLNPKTTRLQVLTEFVEAQSPTKQSLPTGGLSDETLGFGEMTIGRGTAFSVNADGANTDHVPVAKQWERIEGRDFLIEEVLHEKVVNQLQKLPEAKPYEGASLQRRGTGESVIAGLQKIMPKRYAKVAPQGGLKRMAKALGTASPRFVMDYLVTLTSQTNFTFKSDTTYYVSGPINLSGTTTIEGGTVVKFATNTTAQINVNNSALMLKTASYRPAIFTAKDDNSVGESIGGSSGAPSGYYGGGLYYVGVYAGQSSRLHDVRFSYLNKALSLGFEESQAFVLSESQFIGCNAAIYLAGAELNLWNCLFYKDNSVFTNTESETIWRGEHLTIAECNTFNATAKATLNLTNSLLVAITNFDVSGNYELYTNQVVQQANPAAVFQTVGSGSHYLGADSTYRNVGVTNLSAGALASLRSKTTHPPIEITTNFTGVTVLSPQAQRDTDIPDLGYHYPPLDYVVSGRTVAANLALQNGVALGLYGVGGLGLNSGEFSSAGSATEMNWIVSCNTVQEQSTTNWLASNTAISVERISSSPTVHTRFTGWSLLGGGGIHFADSSESPSPAAFTHSQFGGGGFRGGGAVTLTNCLWERVQLYLDSEATPSADWHIYNNLFFGGMLYYWTWSESDVLLAYDNFFDQTAVLQLEGENSFTGDYNGYITNSSRIFPYGSHDVILTNSPVYLTNWLGLYYYPTNDGMLSRLINNGSRYASSAGLYHFTTTTNQAKETNSTVDIGFHYTAGDADGVPLDSDADGVADYLEDGNGNGSVDAGESLWGLAITIPPQNQSVSAGSSVTLTVTAGGIMPLSYQWKFNGNDIVGATTSSLTFNPVSPTNAGTYTVVVTNVQGAMTSSPAFLTITCVSPPSGLVGWWQGEDSTFDTISNYHGYFVSGGYTNGYQNKAFQFDGTNSYVFIPDAPALKPTNLTVEAWVKLDSLVSSVSGGAANGKQFIVFKQNANASGYFEGYTLAKSGSGYFYFGIGNDSDTYHVVTDYVAVQTNVWYHLVGVRGPDYAQLYVNGVMVAQHTGLGFTPTYGNYPLYFGSTGQPYDGKFCGKLDEVALYNRALGSNEIAALFLASSIGKCSPTPKIIPSHLNGLTGNSAILSAVSSGAAPTSYQWRTNGIDIGGATNANLSFNNLQSANAGTYSVILSNSQGVTTTSEALLVSACYPAVDVALVVDRSGSMTNLADVGISRMAAARIACTNFIQGLNLESDQVGLISFATDVTMDQTLTNHYAGLMQKVGLLINTNGAGDTYMAKALLVAHAELTSQRRNTNALPVLVFLTDGEPDDSADAILSIAAQIKSTGIHLITIGLGTNLQTSGLDLLRAMASTTNNFYQATTTAQLTNVYYLIRTNICRGDSPSNQPPEVDWVSPSNDQLFLFSPTNILLWATNSGGVMTEMVFYNGAVELGRATNVPYQFLWQNVTNGSYNLKVIGVNSGIGASSPAFTDITVNAMPMVTNNWPTLQWPLTNLDVKEWTNVTLTCTAWDPDRTNLMSGPVTNVQFFTWINGVVTALPGTASSNNLQWSIVWTNRTAGYHSYFAVAKDILGASSSSPLSVFAVKSTNTLGVVISYPTNGTAFEAGTDLKIFATVTNASGEVTNARVEFFFQTNSIGSDAAAPYRVTRFDCQPGEYTLTAKAEDGFGSTQISAPVKITVKNRPLTSEFGFWDPVFGNPGAAWVDSGRTLQGMALAVTEDRALYVVSELMTTIDAIYVEHAAKWDGDEWSNLGDHSLGGTNNLSVSGYAVKASDGQGIVTTGTVVGDGAYGVVRWDGTNWSRIGESFGGGIVHALAYCEGDLYAGGTFTSVGTNEDIRYIARLIGTNWASAGSGLNSIVHTLAAVNNRLYIGGNFTNVGTFSDVNYLAQLEGTNWAQVGEGVNGRVRTMLVSGDDLYVGGDFTTAGNLTNANHIAKWDGLEWMTIGDGVSGRELPDGDIDFYAGTTVQSLAIRSGELFVGGSFTNAMSQGREIAVRSVACARWNTSQQAWVWNDLDVGIYSAPDPWATVEALTIREGDSSGAFDLFASGAFVTAGVGELYSSGIARYSVGRLHPTNTPQVSILSPLSFQGFDDSSSITMQASAEPVDSPILEVDYYLDGSWQGKATEAPYEYNWSSPTAGYHRLVAKVTDEAGLEGRSPTLTFIVDSAVSFTLNPDHYTIFVNGPRLEMPVLANDLPGGGSLKIIGTDPPASGTVGTFAIGHDSSYLTFTPNANYYGTNVISYVVTNSLGGDARTFAEVRVKARPVIEILSPDCATCDYTSPVSGLIISGSALDWDGTVASVTLLTNGVQYGSPVSPSGTNFSFSWSSSTPGFYQFVAVATDNEGYTNASLPITVQVRAASSPNPPVAAITSPVSSSLGDLPLTSTITIRDGLITNLVGSAYDPDAGDLVMYQLLLLDPRNPNGAPLYNVTPGARNSQGFCAGSVSDASFGPVDLSIVENGSYLLTLVVRGGGDEATASVPIAVDSNLKIGQFSFSEQDLVLPANGIPLTLTRTYNSLNPRSFDFGYSWTYALNSMDVQLDEYRENFTIGAPDGRALSADVEENDKGLPLQVSIRVAGSRDVTLTLPDGRRTTFAFDPKFHPENCQAEARWTAPPGVTETLKPLDSGIINLILDTPPFWWDGGDNSTFDNHDIEGWVLESLDGTKYYLTRGMANTVVWDDTGEGHYIPVQVYDAQPKLTKIVQRSRDEIHISDSEVSHWAGGTNKTRSMFMKRDGAGRITAIFDPNSGVTDDASAANAKALVKYIYNRDTGNLIQVHRLQDRTAGNYLVTKYHYDHPKFPHYITSIEDPRGIPLARNEYDDSGKLTAVVDADGKRTEFGHNTEGRFERVIDRLGNTNTFVYDPKGNVIITTNAVGLVITNGYDGFNNKTNEVAFLNGQPYSTNSYIYQTNLLLASINALGYSNTFLYGQNARLEVSTDARGFSTTNYYDNDTDQLIATRDALGNVTSNYYDGGLLTGTRDALGTVATNYFDATGNLTAMATLEAGGKILSTNTFAYDANGNQTNSVTWRQDGGSWKGATNTTVYDAQNRVVKTIAPDGGENLTFYNALGKQDYTVDALNRTNRFAYDTQGRMWQTTYADGTTNTSGFDAEGRRTQSVDQAGRATTYSYDSLGRMTNTVYVDNTTSGRSYYDGLGRVQFSVDVRGVTNAFGYDILGRRVAVTNGFGTSLATTNGFSYDPNGNQLRFTDARGITVTNLYDPLNRVTNIVFADGTKQLTYYDAGSRRIASVDQANATNRFVYDGAGRLTSVTNALGKATRYEYDEAGNQAAQIDALNRTNKFEFDAMGRRIKRILAGTQAETFGYDKGGNLIYHTNFNAVVITNQYDLMNRLTNRSSVNGYQVAYGYSVTGQRTNMTDATGITSYAYDLRNRVTNVVNAVGTLHYRYDEAGSLTNLWSATANGVNVRYTHDELSRLKTVTNVVSGTPGLAALYGYDAVGSLQTIQYGNNLTNLYRYDALNRLTNAVWKQTTATIADFTYKLGLTGNRTNLSEMIFNGTANESRTYAWKYDAAYRLTEETISGTAPTGTLGYNYDDVGNRSARTGSLGSLGGHTFTYDRSDRLDNDSDPATASTQFDANGNTMSYGGTYQYDVENRLLNANGTVTLDYDGDGNRIKKTASGTTTWYLVATVNPSGWPQVVEEKTGSTPATLSRVYTYGHDLVSQREAGGTTYYFGYDGHGSTRFLMNGSTVANVFAYDAYGTLIASTTTPQTSYLYTGEQYDGDLSFYYLRARYLNPNSGRFWTMDTYEGEPNRPSSLHKYCYVFGNPVNATDPSGHESLIEFMESSTGRTIVGLSLISATAVAYVKAKSMQPVSLADILTRTRPSPSPAPVPETQPKRTPIQPLPPDLDPEEEEELQDKIYRGIPKSRERDYNLALSGTALPRGTALDYDTLVAHVNNQNVASGVTSWTSIRNEAYKKSGFDGIILEISLYLVFDKYVPRPPVAKYMSEHEILLKGPIYGAQPTRP